MLKINSKGKEFARIVSIQLDNIYSRRGCKSKRLIFISRDCESNGRKYLSYGKYGGFITVISRKHDSWRY